MSPNIGGGGNVPSFKSFKSRKTPKPSKAKPKPGNMNSNPQASSGKQVSQSNTPTPASRQSRRLKKRQKSEQALTTTTTPTSKFKEPPQKVTKTKKKKKKQKPVPIQPSLTPKANAQAIQPSSSSSEVFITDTRGDPQNVMYGCPDRYTIPRYHRWGSGYVVGAPGMRIDRLASTDREIVLFPDCSGSGGASGAREGVKVLSSRKGNVGRREMSELFGVEGGEAAEEEVESDFVGLERKRDEDAGERRLRIGGGIWDTIDPGDDHE